ncbi:hypothetical protein Tco_0601400 [Tanacetum coccineum]
MKPKVKANVIEEPSVPISAVSTSTKVSAATTTTATIPTPRKRIDKGKGKMVEEPVKSMKKKDLIRLDEEIASKLQAEFDEEERIAGEKDEANVSLTEEWDDIQAKIDVDHKLAQRLQAEEQEGLSVEEKAKLFQQLLEQRRKHFAAKRAEEQRNKPPTQAQQRKIMCTYLKNMEGKKPKDLKNKSFDSIQKMFDRAFKRVNTFVDFRTKLVEDSLKRAGTKVEQKVTKKQKVDDVQETAEVNDDQEAAKIKELMEIVPNEEEIAIDAIPLATKPPTIIDWKIYKEGKKSYYQIVRANEKSQMYRGRIVGIKSHLNAVSITAALIDVNAAQSNLPSEWNTHVVVWRNKPDLDSMSFDDLYNNFKIVEQEVKRTATSSTSLGFWIWLCFIFLAISNEIILLNVQSQLVHERPRVNPMRWILKKGFEVAISILSMRARRIEVPRNQRKEGLEIIFVWKLFAEEEVNTNMGTYGFLKNLSRDRKLEKKECNRLELDKFENASKCLEQIIGVQVSINSGNGNTPTDVKAYVDVDASLAHGQEIFPFLFSFQRLMEDMLPLVEESEEEKSLVKVLSNWLAI